MGECAIKKLPLAAGMLTRAASLARDRLLLVSRPALARRWCTASGEQPGLLDRFRQAVPPHRVSWFVHGGNMLAVAAMGSDDMVSLRSFMIGASSCAIVYNLLQPKPLIPPACWGLFFIAGHSMQIARIYWDQRAVPLSEEEHDVYDSAFLPYGFTPRAFAALLRHSAWVDYPPGAMIAREGEPRVHVSVVVDGTVDLLVADICVHSIDAEAVSAHSGVWVGDAWDPSLATDGGHDDARHRRGEGSWETSVRAGRRGARVLQFELAGFRDVVASNAGAAAAAERVELDDLSGKLRAADRATLELARHAELAAVESYVELLRSCAARDEAARRRVCEHYRERHQITDEMHQTALRRAAAPEPSAGPDAPTVRQLMRHPSLSNTWPGSGGLKGEAAARAAAAAGGK